jgi:hypothetical protein
MATTSEVKQGLDDIAETIRRASKRYANAKTQIELAATELGQIPVTYADVVAEINTYTPTGAFETLAKDEKAKLTTDFQALKATIDALTATVEYSA